MQICRTVSQMREAMVPLRQRGTVGLVTTMGALHIGHMALVEAAARDHAAVVATIFVNPTQFGDPADLANYPRTEQADLDKLRAAGVAAVFLPAVTDIYPEGGETIVEPERLANMLHGAVRPGHFRGVATVVTKLFNIVGADAAYFGEKDYQQLAVIRQIVRDLHIPLIIHGVPTVRESDGLAMSSRNVRLSAQDRAAAPVLHHALRDGCDVIAQGGTVDAARTAISDRISNEARATLKAIDIVDAATFTPITGPAEATVGIMVSAQFGDTLLIDQMEIAP